jgi:methionine biosynthesis protein MetW
MKNNEAVRGFTTKPVDVMRYQGRSETPSQETPGLLMSMIPEGARILDIGCGTGSLSEMIRDQRRADIVAIEPNPERAARAAETGITVINGIYTDDIPAQYGKFDIVLFGDVLEHLVNPADVLEQVKPALNDSGRVLASIPNVAHWSIRVLLLAGIFDYKPTGIMDATHLRWFTRKGVQRLFDAAGYDIEQSRGSAGAWLPAYSVTPFRLLPYDARSLVLSKFCAVAPGLFSAQHVVSAAPR